MSTAQKTVVVLGTATPGGGFPVYGAAFADTVNETDPTLAVEQRNTKGSTENVPLLEAGRLDIALVQGEVAHEAFSGIGRPPAKVTIVAAMYSTPGMFVVCADSLYRRVEDLRGKPVAFGAKGSGLVILSRYVLDGLGLDQDRDFQAVYLDRAGDGPAMVLDGRTAALWGGGLGWPGFSTVAQGPVGARFIAPDAAGIARILAKHAFLKPMTVPAGAYAGLDAPLRDGLELAPQRLERQRERQQRQPEDDPPPQPSFSPELGHHETQQPHPEQQQQRPEQHHPRIRRHDKPEAQRGTPQQRTQPFVKLRQLVRREIQEPETHPQPASATA